jgi:hypothetical protein
MNSWNFSSQTPSTGRAKQAADFVLNPSVTRRIVSLALPMADTPSSRCRSTVCRRRTAMARPSCAVIVNYKTGRGVACRSRVSPYRSQRLSITNLQSRNAPVILLSSRLIQGKPLRLVKSTSTQIIPENPKNGITVQNPTRQEPRPTNSIVPSISIE